MAVEAEAAGVEVGLLRLVLGWLFGWSLGGAPTGGGTGASSLGGGRLSHANGALSCRVCRERAGWP